MSTPCPCGASPKITKCTPCYRELTRKKSNAYYWQAIAPLKSRIRGRPRKGERRITGSNSTAIKLLSAPLTSS